MSQKIKPANIWGRLGTGLGQGLAEQIPKEMEHYRRKSDLDRFAQEASGLSPIQQVARASSIYGATPEMIRSLSEQAKIQNQANAYRNLAASGGEEESTSPRASVDLSGVNAKKALENAAQGNVPGQRQFAPGQLPQAQMGGQQANAPYRSPVEKIENLGQKERQSVVNENPYNPEAFPAQIPTEKEIAKWTNEFNQLGFTPTESYQKALDKADRQIGRAKVAQQQFEHQEEATKKVKDELKNQTQQRLQKEGNDVYADVIGDMYADVEQDMTDYLAKNPKASYKEVARDYSKRILSLAKTKNDYETYASNLGPEVWAKGNEPLDKLKSYQGKFAALNDEEEYYNMLRRSKEIIPAKASEDGKVTKPEKTKHGLGLSPQGAAIIAFPLQKEAKSYVDSYKPNSYWPPKFGAWVDNGKKAALDLESKITDKDSILAIARALSAKDPNFDQNAFFEQLRKNQEKIRLNERQKRELDTGVRDLLPTWGDIQIFPSMGRG